MAEADDRFLAQARRYAVTVVCGEDADEPFVARTAEFPYTIGIGDSPEEALRVLSEIIADTLEILEEEGRAVPEPLSSFTGIVHLRVPKSLHQALAHRAAAEGTSLNAAASAILAADLGVKVRSRRGTKHQAPGTTHTAP
ncbi:MAG: type II toxin-antitoxin system HicB family antitoxin [Armatimonadetes bacterium]|nr:type II toxin-antitoxin system HicB family antitoxin [Armatimonadota bacterium]